MLNRKDPSARHHAGKQNATRGRRCHDISVGHGDVDATVTSTVVGGGYEKLAHNDMRGVDRPHPREAQHSASRRLGIIENGDA
jgi:hypothetical protein